jgi:hypothetical protein
MSETHCPLCYTALEVADVAPCMGCGNLPEEIEHALSGRHTYAEMRIFGDLTLLLCDFCQVVFGSFNPEVFGLPEDARIGYEKMQFLRDVEEVHVGKDKVCPSCKSRLPFLKFVQRARELYAHVEIERHT